MWVIQARRELAGLEKAKTGVRDELANNLAKLTSIADRKSEVERHLAREHQKLTETDDTEMQSEDRDRIRKLESVISDIELEREARLEALSTNRATLRFRSTESVRHSGGSTMKTPYWLSAFVPCFVSKELLSHRFSQQSAWRSRSSCLRSPAVGEVRRRRLPSHLTRAV